MATVTKTFAFDSDAEGWQATGGTNDTTLGWASAGGNTGGCLSSRIFGRNKSADPHWYYAGTWESMGVPAGARVTHIRLIGFDWRCSEWFVGNESNPAQVRLSYLYDSAGSTQIAVLSDTEPTVLGTTAYASINGIQAAIGSAYQASNTSVQLWQDIYLRNGNDANAAVTILVDNFSIEITYETDAKEMLPMTGQLVLTGYVPTVVVSDNKSVAAATGEVSLEGQAPIVVASDHKNVVTATGEVSLEGQAPIVVASDHKNVVTATGGLVLTGVTPVVLTSQHVSVLTATGELVITGYAPLVDNGELEKYLVTKTGYYVTRNNMLITVNGSVAGDIVMLQEGSDGKYTEIELTTTTTPPTFS